MAPCLRDAVRPRFRTSRATNYLKIGGRNYERAQAERQKTTASTKHTGDVKLENEQGIVHYCVNLRQGEEKTEHTDRSPVSSLGNRE